MSGRWDVLVVDDEPVVRDAARLVLEQEGLRVALAPDGESALAHEALGECRLVLCDMMMPGRDGLEVVAEIRARRPDVAIVLITGYATSENASRALQAGATAFLAKPFDEAELLDQVRRVLEPTDDAGKGGRP
jgi:two-component system C4-dicarboxylate transport response regulator DctD